MRRRLRHRRLHPARGTTKDQRPYVQADHQTEAREDGCQNGTEAERLAEQRFEICVPIKCVGTQDRVHMQGDLLRELLPNA